MKAKLPTPRAIEMAKLMREAPFCDKELAYEMKCSVRTVKSYMKMWFDFAQANNRVELTMLLRCDLFRIGLASYGIFI